MMYLVILGFLIGSYVRQECPGYEMPPAHAPATAFESMFAACPDHVDDQGALAYLYALALDREQRPSDAITVLDTGLRAMSSPDPRTADLFIHLVHRERNYERFDFASRQYLSLLQGLSTGDFPADVRNRLLDELRPILTHDLKARLGIDGDYASLETADLPPDTGDLLQSFWRGADPFPASSRNERLAEHLSRVAAARNTYVRKDGALDARGRTLVRYGPPFRDREIREEPGRELGLQRFHGSPGYVLTGMDHEAPASQIWVYPNIHGSLHFLFVEDREAGGFREGDATELVPFRWAGSPRRSVEFLRIAEDLYRQLALQHADYGLLYDEVASYLSGGGGISGRLPVPAFAHSVVSQMRTLDRDILVRRDAVAPDVHTNLREDLEELPVFMRHARFREPDGSTRLEVYWGLTVDQLRPDGRTRRMIRRWGIDENPDALRYFISATAVLQDVDHEIVGRNVQRFRVGPFAGERGLLRPQSHAIASKVDSFHAVVQWDVLVYDTGDELGPVVMYAAERIERLAALRPSGEALDVSDIRPLLLSEASSGSSDGGMLYPYDILTPGTRVALEFEVYNLRPGSDGLYRYATDYRVERARRGPRLPLLRSDDQEIAPRVRVMFEAETETDRASIVIDPADFDYTGTIEIVLEITDEATGDSVERRIEFDVSRPSANSTTSLAFH